MQGKALLTAAFLALSSVSAQAADTMTVLLDWYVNPNHGPLIIAQEKGYFAARDLQVDLVAPADPNDPPKLVAAGKADVAISYQLQLHLAAAEDIPLVRFATLIGTPLNTVTTLAASPIKSLADLKGKKIGYSVGGVEDALLDTMLRGHGLKIDDVRLINVNFSLAPALLSGQVDAVIGAYRNVELAQLALEGKPGRAFYVEEEGIPPHDELILVAHRNKLADPKLKRLVAAMEQGALYIANHPDDAWKLFIKGRSELDNPVNKAAWALTLNRFDNRPAALSRARYQAFAEFLVTRGLIKQTLPLERYAVELP